MSDLDSQYINGNIVSVNFLSPTKYRMPNENEIEQILSAEDIEEFENDCATFEVIRNKKRAFLLHLHPLHESDYFAAMEFPPLDEMNALIYFATTDEDCATIWDNETIQAKIHNNEDYNGAFPVVEALLRAGEKQRILDLIDSISGFKDKSDVGWRRFITNPVIPQNVVCIIPNLFDGVEVAYNDDEYDEYDEDEEY